MSVGRYLAVAAAILTVCGCTTTSNTRTLQSKFSYPNGDYTPLGSVSAEKSRTTFWNAAVMDKATFDELS